MKRITTTAIVAVVTATLGLSAAAPAFAQPAPAPNAQTEQKPQPERGDSRGNKGGDNRGGRGLGGPGSFLNLTNPGAIEMRLDRLAERLDLTPEQQALFETFKTDSVAAAEQFSGVLDSLRPAQPVDGQPPAPLTISEMITNRIVVATAHLAALEAVQPSAIAFFESLTEEQQAKLMPQRGDGPGQKGQRGDRRGHMGPGEDGHGGKDMRPGGREAPPPPAAPAPAPAPTTNN